MGRNKPSAIPLDRFADAKASKYDKKEILAKKQELKLRKLFKYKKLKRKLTSENLLAPVLPVNMDNFQEEGEPDPEGSGARAGMAAAKQTADFVKRRGKNKRKLSELHEDATAVKSDVTAAKQTALSEQLQRQERIEEVAKARRLEKARYFKKTQRGQPVMKYRMDKILKSLGKGSSG